MERSNGANFRPERVGTIDSIERGIEAIFQCAQAHKRLD